MGQLTAILFISVIALFLNFIIHLSNDETRVEETTGCLGTFIDSLALMSILVLTIICMNKISPTALDVYRGNTELEIHSVNGVPTDTVIIYKKK